MKKPCTPGRRGYEPFFTVFWKNSRKQKLSHKIRETWKCKNYVREETRENKRYEEDSVFFFGRWQRRRLHRIYLGTPLHTKIQVRNAE